MIQLKNQLIINELIFIIFIIYFIFFWVDISTCSCINFWDIDNCKKWYLGMILHRMILILCFFEWFWYYVKFNSIIIFSTENHLVINKLIFTFYIHYIGSSISNVEFSFIYFQRLVRISTHYLTVLSKKWIFFFHILTNEYNSLIEENLSVRNDFSFNGVRNYYFDNFQKGKHLLR